MGLQASLAYLQRQIDALKGAIRTTDPRLTDARTPTAHAASHADGGSDPLDVTALAGYPGGGTTFLRDDGTFATVDRLAILTADPASPANDTGWLRRTGASPAMEVELRVRIAGTTYTLGGITI